MLHDPAEKIKSCDFWDSSSNRINGYFHCWCCSSCCFNTMLLCHSFSQGLNSSWPPTLHVSLQRWCLVEVQWKSRTNTGKVGRASVFPCGTDPSCDWPWSFDPPDPDQAQQHLTQCSTEVGRSQTSLNLSTPCGCPGDVKQTLLSCRRRRRRILTYRSHGSQRVNRKWVTYFSHVCHPVSQRHSFLATKVGDKRRGAVWVSESLNLWVGEHFASDSQGETRQSYVVRQFCWNTKLVASFVRVHNDVKLSKVHCVVVFYFINNCQQHNKELSQLPTWQHCLLTAAFSVDENTKTTDGIGVLNSF